MRGSILASRRPAVAALAVLLVFGAFGAGHPASARAGLYSPIPANAQGDPTDTFRSDDALFVYAVSDIKGGRVCIVPPTGDLESLSCDAPAWGTPNVLVGLGTVYSLMEAPYLRVGSWRLLTATVGDVQHPSEPIAVSGVFTVEPCDASCDPSISQEIVDEFKTTIGQQWKMAFEACVSMLAFSALQGMASDFHAGIQGTALTEALKAKLKAKLTDEQANAEQAFEWSFGQPTLVVDPSGGVTVAWDPAEGVDKVAQDKAVGILQNLVCTLGAAYLDLANDPANPDFLKVEPLTQRPVPDLGDAPDNALGTATDTELGYVLASLTALERYGGANAAGDLDGVHRQTAALSGYVDGLVTATQATAAALRADAAQADAVPEMASWTFPDEASRDARQALYDRIRDTGFVQSEIDDLHALGLDDAAIASLREEFSLHLAVVPVGVSYGDILRQVADGFEADVDGMARFARAAAGVAQATNQAPTAAFTATPATGARPLQVTFENTSSDPANDPLTYAWDFGDGTTSAEKAPVHTYTDTGSYLVSLTVSDGQLSGFTNGGVEVTPPGTPPVARFSLPRYVYRTGDSVHLVDESTDLEGPIAERHWFGSAAFSSFTDPETDVTFQSPGLSEVTLQVTDDDGWTRSVSHTATVFDSLPIAGTSCGAAAAGVRDSAGSEFYLGFEQNITGHGVAVSLAIAAPVATSGIVEVPGTGFSTPFSVTPGAITTVDIPTDAVVEGTDRVTAQAVHVCADDEITVYGINSGGFSADTYLGIPLDALGTRYVVLSRGADISHFQSETNERSQFAIVATADDTDVLITPSIDVGGHPAGVPFHVDLGRFMTYQLRADLDREDLTGTRIQSTRPIAVLAGDSCTDIPSGVAACDHTVEQLPPVNTWGKAFAFASLAGVTSGDLVRVLAASDGTEVALDGSTVATLDAGAFTELDIPSGTAHTISASKPVLVGQFEKSLDADGTGSGTGDPLLMLVTPTAQFANGYTVESPGLMEGYLHYLNLVVPTGEEGECLVDGAPPAGTPEVIAGSTWTAVRESVAAGTHVVTCPDPFGIWAYGQTTFESYGNPGGANLTDLGANRAPVAADDSATTAAGSAVDVDVLANDADPDGDPLTVTAVGPAAHGTTSIVAGTARYVPAAGFSGPDSFSYTVGDGDLSATATVRVTVEAPGNQSPRLDAVTDPTIPELVPWSITATGTDPEGGALSWSVRTGPAGLTVGSSTGLVSWTPAEADGPGTASVTLRATDPLGAFTDVSFTIHVTEVNAAPTMDPVADRTAHPTEQVTASVSAADADLPANTLAFSLVSGPGSVVASSGAWSWTPAVADVGDHAVTIGVSDGAGGSTSRSFTVHVVRRSTSLAISAPASVQYSDGVVVSATLTSDGVPLAGMSVTLGLGAATRTATTNANGVASTTFAAAGPAGSVAATASFGATGAYAGSSASATVGETREDATIAYTGDTNALVGSGIALRATVTDSAATGYAGSNPESGAGATIGDVTTMRVAFDVYAAGSCLSGSPLATLSAGVSDTGPAGDGIGAASVTWTGAAEGSYCVVPRLIGSSASVANGFYVAGPAVPGGVAVYRDASTGMVTGGGWTSVANGEWLNFGFNAQVSKTGVKGQLVTALRTSIGGRRVVLVVKSNALDALRVTGTVVPITGVLTGKASLKVIALDGTVLSETGNATFTATFVDGGPGGTDSYGIRVIDKTGVVVLDTAPVTLGGGQIVAHVK